MEEIENDDFNESTVKSLKTITLKVSPDFHKKLKLYATNKGLSIKDYLVNMAEEDMAKAEET